MCTPGGKAACKLMRQTSRPVGDQEHLLAFQHLKKCVELQLMAGYFASTCLSLDVKSITKAKKGRCTLSSQRQAISQSLMIVVRHLIDSQSAQPMRGLVVLLHALVCALALETGNRF
jgi:hypothetical protein